MAKRSGKMMMHGGCCCGGECGGGTMMGCCASWKGITHLIGGAGLALLVVSYFGVSDILFWGWVLVGIAIGAHLWKMMGH